ncbi:hypothetical protein HaLaN_04870, partial [Haematococcus lacustris]
SLGGARLECEAVNGIGLLPRSVLESALWVWQASSRGFAGLLRVLGVQEGPILQVLRCTL